MFKYTVKNFGQLFLKQNIHLLKGRAIHLLIKKTLFTFQLLSSSCLLYDLSKIFRALTSLSAEKSQSVIEILLYV